ncbi:MAG: efflux RND transporter periplasmic adaptor subunit [Phenylobacterium sp.]|uniref:efflux RND transporter periplasmic adaptor subunit n=1 Tax=Phenylobacterium sp. TaxID=1871053 RepID=UPI001A5B828E|nr:efflux RND transporter periplasmic adaptor subunit [Phenylobacterium sp.]MBL8771371.1 efflux RND transporter periplasmic adaptor subunit [Phenylobacterium sp.]
MRSIERLALGLAVLFLLSACGPRTEPRPSAPLVRVAAAAPAAAGEAGYTGVIRARYESDLGFRAPGKISVRLVDAGDAVRAGQVLARLDPADLRLGAAAAVAQVAAAERSAAAARAEAIRLQADEARFRKLNAQGFASGQRYDQARAAAQAASANLAAAEAQVRAAQAQASQAGNQAAYTALIADSDGIVMRVLAEPGQVVAAGQPIVRLARDGAREAVIAVPETARAALPRTATAELYGGNGRPMSATLRELSAAADPVTRTFEARYALAAEPGSVPLGATVTVLTRPAGAGGGLSVPIGALHDSGSGPGVWLVDPRSSRVTYRKVTVRSLGEETAVLAGGLRPGDRVVSLGVHLLRPGQVVRPMTAQTASR